MAHWTVTLDAAWFGRVFTDARLDRIQWQPPGASRPQIPAALQHDSSTPDYLSSVRFDTSPGIHRLILHITGSTSGGIGGGSHDLSTTFEQDPHIRVESRGETWDLHDATFTADLGEPYLWDIGADGQAAFDAFITAVAEGDQSVAYAATMTLWDGAGDNPFIDPEFESATVSADGSQVALTFTDVLDPDHVPGRGRFTVRADGTKVNVSSAADSRAFNGSVLTLTLDGSITAGQTVTISYSPPSGTDSRLQDSDGNFVPAFLNQTVTNLLENIDVADAVGVSDAASVALHHAVAVSDEVGVADAGAAAFTTPTLPDGDSLLIQAPVTVVRVSGQVFQMVWVTAIIGNDGPNDISPVPFDTDTVEGGGAANLVRLEIVNQRALDSTNETIEIQLTTSGPDLVEAWERASRALTLAAGGTFVSIAGPDNPSSGSRDATEPYVWDAPTAQQDAISAFLSAYDGFDATAQASTKAIFSIGITARVGDEVGIADAAQVEAEYVDTPGDGAVIADSVGIVADYEDRTAGDEAGVADAFAVALHHDIRISDAVGIADEPTEVLVVIPVKDTAGIADTAQVEAEYVVRLADDAGAADAFAVALHHDIRVSDAVGIAETSRISYNVPAGDKIGIADAATTAQHHRIAISDGIVLAEGAGIGYFVDLADKVGVAETTVGIGFHLTETIFDRVRINEDIDEDLANPFNPQADPFAPVLDLPERLALLLPQYDASTRLQSLVREIIGVVDARIADPLRIIERAMNPDESEGVLLDWLGQRIGYDRPFVASGDARYLGFEGTRSQGGRPFNQAPYWTLESGIEQVEPVGDTTYRILLKGRARRLRGGADRQTIEAVIHIVFGYGYLDERTDPIKVVVRTSDDVLYGVVAGESFEALIPRPAGRPMEIERMT